MQKMIEDGEIDLEAFEKDMAERGIKVTLKK